MATDHYTRNHEVVLSAAKKYRRHRQLSPDEAIVWEEISDTERQQALYDVKEKEDYWALPKIALIIIAILFVVFCGRYLYLYNSHKAQCMEETGGSSWCDSEATSYARDHIGAW